MTDDQTAAVHEVMRKLQELATSHNLETKTLNYDRHQPLTERDKAIGHDAQAAAFELAINLLSMAGF